MSQIRSAGPLQNRYHVDKDLTMTCYEEILKIIEKYGLPQDWNRDGRYGPERYIEAHVWSDETICKYGYSIHRKIGIGDKA